MFDLPWGAETLMVLFVFFLSVSVTVFLVHEYTAVAGTDPPAWLISEFAAVNTTSIVIIVGNPTNSVICEWFLMNKTVFFVQYTVAG